ncbi:MAG: leucyl aminopeptidase [Deltaproteobacteria bacterium]|nr:leucyl aminopeptidase [Deltaproteobacteria bacterium]
MRLQFVSPLLHELDRLEAEVLLGVLWQDVRPADGIAGLCDFRLGGRLSRWMLEGYLTGAVGEALLVPGKPAFGFEKLLFVGAGARATFDDARFEQVLATMLKHVDGLATRSVVAELPGRQGDVVTPEHAADRLLAALAAPKAKQASWTVVEELPARRRIEQQLVEERRRLRPVL